MSLAFVSGLILFVAIVVDSPSFIHSVLAEEGYSTLDILIIVRVWDLIQFIFFCILLFLLLVSFFYNAVVPIISSLHPLDRHNTHSPTLVFRRRVIERRSQEEREMD
jgi:hypothetical protein